MTLRRDRLTKDEALTVAKIEDCVPRLAEAAALVGDFQNMVRDQARPPRRLAAEGRKEPAFFVRARSPDRPRRGRRRHGRGLVERPSGRIDQPPENTEAPDVRPRQTRPAQGEDARCMKDEACTEIESEPFFHAGSQHSRLGPARPAPGDAQGRASAHHPRQVAREGGRAGCHRRPASSRRVSRQWWAVPAEHGLRDRSSGPSAGAHVPGDCAGDMSRPPCPATAPVAARCGPARQLASSFIPQNRMW